MCITHSNNKLLICSVLALLCSMEVSLPGCSTESSNQPVFETTLVMKNTSGSITNNFTAGESITLELTITNLAENAQALTLPGPTGYDFIISDNSQVIWRWSELYGGIGSITELSFAPHETKGPFIEVWNQKDKIGTIVPAGNYIAQGFICTADEGCPPLSIKTTGSGTRSQPLSFQIL